MVTSKVFWYLGSGGLCLKKLFIACCTNWSWPTGFEPGKKQWNLLIVDLAMFIVAVAAMPLPWTCDECTSQSLQTKHWLNIETITKTTKLLPSWIVFLSGIGCDVVREEINILSIQNHCIVCLIYRLAFRCTATKGSILNSTLWVRNSG